MKISLNWLSDYVDVSMPAGELSERLMHAGFCIEEIAETADDIVLDVEVTSNRPDLLGHIGMAREIAAATGAAFKAPVLPALPTSGKAADLATVEVPAPDLCPRYTARVIRGVKIGPSPDWLVRRLEAVGLRSVNNVVDVTNYVLMEYSQPLHSFDYDKLAGHKIIVRRASAGETMTAIDGTVCRLDESMLVIADAKRPVAIAGIMGGLDSEVSAGTVNILLESAQFDPLATRKASRKLALISPSNYRFERGIDPVGVEQASLRACQLILELAGGQLAEGVIDVWAKPFEPPVVSLRPQRTNKLLGIEVPTDRQVEILTRLGLSPKLKDGQIVCAIPPHRADLTREIDLIEEVARLHGYDKIPVGGKVTHAVQPEGRQQRLRREACQILAACGFDEAVTFTFIDQVEAKLFQYGKEQTVCVDPINRRTNNTIRPTLMPSLMKVCKTNQDMGTDDLSVFEIASVIYREIGKQGELNEHLELGLATTGELRYLRGTIETLIERLGLAGRIAFEPAGELNVGGFAARINVDGRLLGAMGLANEDVLEYYGLKKPIALAEIYFDRLLELARPERKYQPIPVFPPIKRDLSFIVDDSAAWSKLAGAVESVRQDIRESCQFVTIYRGKPIPEGKKSVTIRLTYRSSEGTLRSEQVDEAVQAVVSAVKAGLGAELRV
ncbi:MAG: phenylalanine--tRNA ligase subunit beta [Planctomycetes bacterium]|nr:phenylalanine--tRNA ligase subunit beta [Planctomycetota bacterium]